MTISANPGHPATEAATAAGALRLVAHAGTGLAWAYAAAIPVAFELSGRTAQQLVPLAAWIATPLHVLAIAMIGLILFLPARHERQDRRIWWQLALVVALNALAGYGWNVTRPDSHQESIAFTDWLYLADYWCLTAVYATLFRRAGGSFGTARVWLDGAAMTAVQLVALWSFFLEPSFPNGLGHTITVGATFSYTLTLAVMMAMAALLCLQLPNWRREPTVLLLVGAGAAVGVWEVVWLASWLVDFEFIGPYYNYGDVLCLACIISTVSVKLARRTGAPQGADPARPLHSFLPAISALVGIGMVAGTLATTRALHAWILVGLVALSALLLITRQRRADRELYLLNQKLVAREADARLTELVRRSTDLILVVDAARHVSFASPAAETMLGMAPQQLQGRPFGAVLGSVHETVLASYLDRLLAQGDAAAALELRMDGPAREYRVLKIDAANQLGNPLIKGLVVTISDVTTQRLLEREVLDAATRERARLSADIHDGLGQELTGIAMLLHVAAIAPDADPERQRCELEGIVGQVNQTIATARDLARGLSPLHVVRGALGGALRRLAQESRAAVGIQLRIDPQFDEPVVDEFCGEHLYRIAQEAVTNAVRHSGCHHIEIELQAERGTLVLGITDDGAGVPRRASNDGGLGLRLMEYRARMMGGALRMVDAAGGGTRIEVTVPLPSIATALSG